MSEQNNNESRNVFTDVREEFKEITQEAKATISGQQLNTAGTVGGAGYRADNKTSSGIAVASLVCGILSLVCAWFGIYLSIAGLVLGLVGVVLGAKARKESQTGMATAGFVCSLIGVVLCGVMLVCAIACYAALQDAVNQLSRY